MKTKILHVLSKESKGTATWSKDTSGWRCNAVSSPSLRWILAASPTEAQATLTTLGAHYRWLDPQTQEHQKPTKTHQIPFEQRYDYDRQSTYKRRLKRP